MRRMSRFVAVAAVLASVAVYAQTGGTRPASPSGTAATNLGGERKGDTYEGGNWIEVTYSRPILRQRPAIFGAGADYGKTVNSGAPVWRAGANQTTRFKSEVPLSFGGKTLPAGEYSMFVDLKEKEWTLIFSTWAAQQTYDPNNKAALWGSFGYTPDKDVLRTPMKVEVLPFSVDEMTISFLDVTKTGGRLAIMWEKTLASAAFTVAAK